MPEIGTSGSISGDGKRSVAEWPKLPRPSSTLPKRSLRCSRRMSVVGGEAENMCSARVFRLLTHCLTWDLGQGEIGLRKFSLTAG
jgi:hypothetical protein